MAIRGYFLKKGRAGRIVRGGHRRVSADLLNAVLSAKRNTVIEVGEEGDGYSIVVDIKVTKVDIENEALDPYQD